MRRHVIKGRGENRGKYLCYARMAPELAPTEDGFVWLSEQRKAARWEDPSYSGRTYATGLAIEHDGYFVKLIAPAALTRDVVRGLQGFIAGRAAGAVEKVRCYWFGGNFHDAGEDFCRECAEKLVDEKYAADPKAFEEEFGEDRYDVIDGGFDVEHDSPPYCETCGAKLSGFLTDYGADQEIDALTGECAPRFDNAEGWAALSDATVNLSDDDPRWRKIARVVDAAREEGRRKKEAQAALAASPGMPEARLALLGVLRERAAQKASEPSYRLWTELLRWRRLSTDALVRQSKRNAVWEKRLLKEAEAFLGILGYERDGWNCFKAPYGAYIWSFVVMVEQHRLWQTPAFLEGRAYMMHPCPSGDPAWPHHRDANPYPDGTVEHDAWDGGYISTMKADRS